MSQQVVYLKPENALEEKLRGTSREKLVELPTPSTSSSLNSREIQKPGSQTPAFTVVPFKERSPLHNDLDSLARLIANITESYTACIYLKKSDEAVLSVGGVHTLSRDFNVEVEIGFGCGLIGWTAENAVRISVSPFEHSATTLLCYQSDQSLKSFIAVPVFDKHRKVIGVIACDSKKSYAFPKVTEKILNDCAEQVMRLLELHSRLQTTLHIKSESQQALTSFTETLYGHQDEAVLLSKAAALPEYLIERDALVIVVTADGVSQEGTFYAPNPKKPLDHWLFQLVCQHKKVICKDRVVHVLPSDDPKQRSFLSIPFHILGQEVGSFNFLSLPYQAFDAAQIAAVEKIAGIVGRELERIRLRERLASIQEASGALSWKHFATQAQSIIEEAQKKRKSLSLVRIAVSSLLEIEDFVGIDMSVSVLQKLLRLVDQVKHRTSIACHVYGFHLLLLTDTDEAQRTTNRFCKLVERLSFGDKVSPGLRLNERLFKSLKIVSAATPHDGDTLEELAAKTLRLLEGPVEKKLEVTANVRNWA